MIIKYVNNSGDAVNLNQYPYKMLISDILDYEFEIVQSNSVINGFNSAFIKSKELNIDIHRWKGSSSKIWMNRLTDIFVKDIIAIKPGRLYIDDWYMECFINGRETSRWQTDTVITAEYNLCTSKPVWIKEATKQFLPQSSADTTDGLDFPFDFAFDFASDQVGIAKWSVDHYAPSDFQMIIYGPCTEPRILINDHPYQIYTELEASDYLIIDSRKNTVTKYLANGTAVNLYNSRNFKYSVFEKIPAGDLTINWNGSFGFDITLYLERSEPKWGTS